MLEHHHPNGGFVNPWLESTLPARLGGLLRWRLVDRVKHPPPPDPDPATLRLATPQFAAPRAAVDRLTITWVGHSTFLVQIGGRNLLTDPIWSGRASPVSWAGPRRWVPPGVPFEALPPLDAVLLSHNHYDHLDDATVRRLVARAPGARWLVPLGLAPYLRARGATEVSELDWWQETRLEPILVGCTPAQHFSGRSLRDRNRSLWCGWSLTVPARQVFFAGDTGYHREFAGVGKRFGPFDVALLPIGAYEPRWFMRPVHMNPEEAVQALLDLGPARMIPMHWGTFKLTDEPMDEPPKRARDAWGKAGLPADQFSLLAHGETLVI